MWRCDQHPFCTCGVTILSRTASENAIATSVRAPAGSNWVVDNDARLLSLCPRRAPVEAVGTLHAISEDGNYNFTHRPSSARLVILDCLIRFSDIAFCCCCCSVSCVTFTALVSKSVFYLPGVLIRRQGRTERHDNVPVRAARILRLHFSGAAPTVSALPTGGWKWWQLISHELYFYNRDLKDCDLFFWDLHIRFKLSKRRNCRHLQKAFDASQLLQKWNWRSLVWWWWWYLHGYINLCDL